MKKVRVRFYAVAAVLVSVAAVARGEDSAGALLGGEPRAGTCQEECDRKASACVDVCDAKYQEDRARVPCKLACIDDRKACAKNCGAP